MSIQINHNATGNSDPSTKKQSQDNNVGTYNEYATAIPKCDPPVIVTGSLLIHAEPALILSVNVIVATTLGAIEIRHGSALDGGVVIETIPVTTPEGTRYEFDGHELPNGLFIQYVGTAAGTLRVASKIL